MQDIKNKIIVRKIQGKSYVLRNVSLSIAFILIIFIFDILLAFLFNLNILYFLFINFILLLTCLFMVVTILNPKILNSNHHNSLVIQREEIKDVKSNVNILENPGSEYQEEEAKVDRKPRINIKKYNYIGSSETKVYHKNSCRFAKTIHTDYMDYNNKESYFKNKGYKPCMVCIEGK
ncbi:MAG: hypothetical protein AABX03_00040 [Nanoarchaeota archaeon]